MEEGPGFPIFPISTSASIYNCFLALFHRPDNGSSCFFHFQLLPVFTKKQAFKNCRAHQAHLAMPSNAEKQKKLQQVFDRFFGSYLESVSGRHCV